MALTPAFDLGLGPRTVKQLGYTSDLDPVEVMRGPLPVAVPVTNNLASSSLPAGKRLFWGIKLPTAIKGDWLVLAELTQAPGSVATSSYLGTLLLNNAAVRAAMHAEPSDALPEVSALPCLGEVFYTDADGVSNAVPGQNFSFTINAPLVNDTESISQSPGVLNPKAEQVPLNLAANATPVTKRTGAAGDLAALANVVTVGRKLGQTFLFIEAATGNQVQFQLVAGAAAVGDPNQVAPADFDAVTNPVHFALVPTAGAAAPTFAVYDVINAQRLVGVRGDGLTPLVPGPFGGRVRVTDQGGREEEFQGPLAGEAGAGCTVSGAGTAGCNLAYTPPDTAGGTYNDVAFQVYSWANDGNGGWNLLDGNNQPLYHVAGVYPWSAACTVVNGTAPAPTVARNDAANDDNWRVVQSYTTALPSGSAVTIDFGDRNPRHTLALVSDVTFSGATYGPDRSQTIILQADNYARALTFPAGWVPVGSVATSIPAGKRAVLTLDCDGTTEADVTYALALQP